MPSSRFLRFTSRPSAASSDPDLGLPAGPVRTLRFLVPSALALLAVWSLLRLLAPVNRAGDLYWSLAQGRWMLAHHSVIRHGLFSYGLGSRPAVISEWLYQVILSVAARTIGVTAFILLSYLAVLGVFATLLKVYGASRTRGLVLFGVALWLFTPYVAQGRALTCSLVLLPLLLILLRLARCRPRLLAFVPFLMLLWINLHGSALVGAGVLALYAGFAWLPLSPDHPRRYLALLVTLTSLLALLVTPYGPGLLAHDISLSTDSQIHFFIQEWRPPDLAQLRWLLVLFVVLAVLVRVWRHRTRLEPFLVAALVALTAAWLQANRTLPYLLLVVAALFVVDAKPILRARPARLGAAALCAGLGVGLVLALVTDTAVFTGVENPMPIAAVAYLDTHHVTSRVLTWENWGGYLITHGHSSFVDGRLDIYPRRLISDYILGLLYHPDLTLLSHYRVSYVLWPPHTALDERLRHDPAWRLVLVTTPADLFVRVSGIYADVSGVATS